METLGCINILDKNDLMKIAKGQMDMMVVNIFDFDNDMRFLVTNIDGIDKYIDVETGEIKSRGIFIDMEDLKTFLFMDMAEKAEFYAMAIGDKFHDGYGIFVGKDEDGDVNVMLVDSHMKVKNNAFWFAYEYYNFYRITYEQMIEFIENGEVVGKNVPYGKFFVEDWCE